MSTSRINYNPLLTRRLVADGVFKAERFSLVDVGASGGIEQHWRIFDDQLMAVGFDPLVKECARLNQAEQSPYIRYHAFCVGSDDYASLLPPEVAADPVKGWSNQPFPRTSAVRAQQAMNVSFTKRFNNEDDDIVLTDKATSLDSFFSIHPAETVDFIKIDTDGHDYEVLCGAKRLLSKYHVLGLFIECQFHGIVHPHANLFSNIDRFLRDEGFSLFDIEVHRYTRACLPGRFVYDIPAQTTSGQVLWGDALYLRDVAADGYENRWGERISTHKLLKLACLFEMYGLPDCSVELLLAREEELKNVVNVASCLDILAKEMDPSIPSYADYDRKFDSARDTFFPSAFDRACDVIHNELSQRKRGRGLLKRVRRYLDGPLGRLSRRSLG